MNERTIFIEALEHDSPDRRAEFLDSACAGDAPLRQRVEALLVSHEQASGFLARPASEGLAERLSYEPTTDVTLDGAAADELDGDELEFLTPSDKPGALGRLGHYDILETIGRGGMGIVLRAFDETLHRVVAIKIMASQLATSTLARKRFAREAHAAAAVSHEHVVTIHAVEEANGRPFIVMHYVSGLSLQERLDRDGPLELHEILRIGMQTASGLAAAHAQGLIHRDIKPDNILLENGVERVKITDFGLARVADDASLTQSGVVAGTPHYMAPEQARGEALDTRTDLFSLGSVLYAMCTGRTPFRASGSMAVLKRVCEETPTPIRETNPEMPDWLAAIIDKLHAKDPAERFQTAAEVADLLGRHLAHVQHPSVVPLPAVSSSAFRRSSGRPPEGGTTNRRYAIAAAIMLVCLLGGLSLTEATGVTQLATTVVHIFTPEGTLAVEVNDPAVKVTIEGDGGLLITGAGPQEVRLKPGSYKVLATKDGQPVKREVVTIARGGKQVVNVSVEDHAPARASVPPVEVRRFEGHTLGVQTVAIFANGGRIVSGGDDQTVRLWDLNTGKELRRFEGHTASVYSVAFSPDGSRVLSGSVDRTVRLWDVETGKELRRLSGHTDAVACVAFLPDGRRALTGGNDNVLRLWDVDNAIELRRFEGHKLPIYGVAVSSDGRRALSGGWDKTMRLWDVESGEELRRFEGHDGVVKSVAFSPDGCRALSAGGTDKTVRLWNLETGEELRRFGGHNGWAHSAAFSPDGHRMVSGGTSIVYWWDVESGRLLQSFPGHTGEVADVAYAPDGRHVLSAGWVGDNTLRLWKLPDPNSGQELQSERGAFVLQGGKGVAERKFDTLAEAVERSSDGDTIEIRGNGPFVSDGVTIGHPLVVRAGEGYTPSITLSQASADKNIPLLTSPAALVLEGLELRRMGGADGKVENRLPRLLGLFGFGAVRIANCRLIIKSDQPHESQAALFGSKARSMTVLNSELNCNGTGDVVWRFASGGRCNIENCVIASSGLGFALNEEVIEDVSIDVRGNTFIGVCLKLTLWSKPNLPVAGEAAPPIRLDFSRNVTNWDVSRQAGILYFHQYQLDAPFSTAEAEANLPHLLRLDEQQNVHQSGTRLLRLAVDWKLLEGARGHDLADWNRLWNQSDTGSVEGHVRFQGGDLLQRAKTAPEQLTPDDFRLRPDSAGYRAGPDGKDLGADVDLVGPGAAYERWKKTPEYQEWIKETKQAREADRATTESEVFAKELAKWQGEWENPKYGKLVIKGDRWASYPQKGFEVVSKIKIVEVSDEMTHLLLLSAGVDGKVRTIQTILRVDGDILHNCGTTGAVRPTEFTNQPGIIYTQWKRVSNSKP